MNVLYHTHISLIRIYMYTQNNEFILNALLECNKFFTGTHWDCFIREYPSVCSFVTGTGLAAV